MKPIEATFGGFLSRQRLQVDSPLPLRQPILYLGGQPFGHRSSRTLAGTHVGARCAYATQARRASASRSQAVFHTDTDAAVRQR
jgi:iron complex outermembrane receptor protein